MPQTFLRSLLLLCCTSLAGAEVLRLEIDSREPLLEGREFGEAGAYEKLSGTIHFAFEVDNEFNASIVDLALAPCRAGCWPART